MEIIEIIEKLLKKTLQDFEERDLGEALPHEFFVALGVAEQKAPTEEALRLMKELGL